ncbi:MAG: glycerol-3-phosphate 1-O-acyltransferase PlsY [Mesorhizobium sp.]
MDWAGNLPYYVAIIFVGYLLGSIPFGLIITRLAGMGDVRRIGSGNIGATNVLRTGSRKLAAATLLGDALKGTVAVFIGAMWGPGFAIAAGFAAFIGHLFPIWLGFKGGKGVATYLGVLLGLSWKVALVFAVVWLAVAALTRYSSLAALLAAVATPLALFWWGPTPVAWLFTAMSLIVFLKHHANIRRLLDGDESKIGAKG